MKQTFFSVLIVLTFSIPAQARSFYHHYGHKHYHHLTHRYSHYLTKRHFRHYHRYAHRRRYIQAAGRSPLPGPCQVAAGMGGPCGCWTEWHTRGFLDHVRDGINWWLAGDWLRFQQAIPVPGTAAVWKNRSHVAPVMYANADGSVTVRDYWGVHRVQRKLVVIVDPHPPIKAGWRVAESWPL